MLLRESEELIGTYRNDMTSTLNLLVVTNLGIHVCRGPTGPGWEIIYYSDIEEVFTPPCKTKARSLTIQTREGKLTEIPVVGGEGRLRDAFEMLRFLIRVTDDLKRSR